MPIIDPDQGVPTPAGTDLADNPAAFTNFYTPVLSRLNLRYPDEANRTLLHPANINGEESYLTASGRKERNTGVLWRSSAVGDCYAYVRRTTDAATISANIALQHGREGAGDRKRRQGTCAGRVSGLRRPRRLSKLM